MHRNTQLTATPYQGGVVTPQAVSADIVVPTLSAVTRWQRASSTGVVHGL